MQSIRNIVIIAHVDHGKTTLVDAMLKQTHTFRDNQKEMGQTLIMDSNELEKEKGITILAKNTAVVYHGVKINIVDTPGHADFGGEVERVMNMADGALLLVDAAEGPLPQTKFVLKKALAAKLKIILLINKIDKKDAQVAETVAAVENLFLELAEDASDLNFKTLYCVGRDGKAFVDLPAHYSQELKADLTPIFETIVADVPEAAVSRDKPFQILISTLDWDSYVGRLCIGRVNQGFLQKDQMVALVEDGKILGTYKAQKLYTSVGLLRQEVDEVSAGDIVAIAGIPQLTIGQTVTDPLFPKSLPTITVEEPTIKITIGPSTSPLSGQEGKFCSSIQIKQRLSKEVETNLGLRISEDPASSNFIVAGRGELHLAILIETMRREGFELQVSKPQVIYKTIDGEVCEPYEEATIEVDQEFVGLITEEMAKRKANLVAMSPEKNNTMRFVYKISSHNLLGIRNSLLTKTRGTALIYTYFMGYFPKGPKMELVRNGALISFESGISLSYGLDNAQNRGSLFIGPGENVYEGMVIGISSRLQDMEINVCKGKHLTNMHTENSDIAIALTPPIRMDIEQALDFINEDEMLEVTPKTLRIRKKYLSHLQRKRTERREKE